MKRGTGRSLQPTLFALLLVAGGLVPDLRAQAAAPTAGAPAAPAGVRTLYLVRHGAYDIDDPRDEAVGRGLLPIGVAQARLTGDRLRGLPFTLDSIVASPLTRARETAEVIAAELAIANPGAPGVGLDPDLAECTPPTRRADIMAKEKPEELAACSAQLERLAARLLMPAPAGDRRESWSPTATSSAGWSPAPWRSIPRPGSACRSATPASPCCRSTAKAWCASSPSAMSATSRPGCRPAPTAIARTGI